jgi:hypothetical protein
MGSAVDGYGVAAVEAQEQQFRHLSSARALERMPLRPM